MGGWGRSGGNKRRSSSRKAPGDGLQVGPLLGHLGQDLLQVAASKPRLEGPEHAFYHTPQPVD